MTWKAGDLGADLAAKLGGEGWICVREIALCDRLSHRGDLVAMLCSGSINRVDIYELKVARSDLLGDLRREKWRAYLEHGAVWFAYPKGLADPREIPAEAGVIIRSDASWRRVRAPGRFGRDPSVALMRRLVMAVSSQAARAPKPRKAALWNAEKRARTELGRRVARVAVDIEVYEKSTSELKDRHRELQREVWDLESRLRTLRAEERRAGSLFPARAFA